MLTSAYERMDRFRRWWANLRLTQRFVIAATIIMLLGMISIGHWVSTRITIAVTDNTAIAAALYMEGSVGPLIQELASSDWLSTEAQGKLDGLLEQSFIRDRIISMKIWRLDGTILYNRWKQMIGKQFPASEAFREALAGKVSAQFESAPHEEDNNERAEAKPLLEIYAPVRSTDTRRIIAVAEFYANGEQLKSDLQTATIYSWLFVGTVTLLMIGALSGIVAGASRTIEDQRAKLGDQVVELRGLLRQNENLRNRLQSSNETVADINERFLQRIGSDLHDGPAQLLTYAMIRLHKFESIIEKSGDSKDREEVARMRTALGDTLREVRQISSGLALPELEPISLANVIILAIDAHEEHTGTTVERSICELPDHAPQALKICVFRFIQESLTNAYRHADGKGQRVAVQANDDLKIVVSDTGSGFTTIESGSNRLGLSGMRARIESIGGTLEIETNPGRGTRLTAIFNLAIQC
ncbi:sensor histidine kinase [Bradyrhizobium sp.]|uniref:sensor histidine kinase n=1 Tax=Bradyrhizobium sp. TaxID=376 RepID=UPI0025C232C7|nr:sensor histidine kinase [Bradyrhizobium sp.]